MLYAVKSRASYTEIGNNEDLLWLEVSRYTAIIRQLIMLLGILQDEQFRTCLLTSSVNIAAYQLHCAHLVVLFVKSSLRILNRSFQQTKIYVKLKHSIKTLGKKPDNLFFVSHRHLSVLFGSLAALPLCLFPQVEVRSLLVDLGPKRESKTCTRMSGR